MLTCLYLLKFDKLDTDISLLNFNSKRHDKCKFALTLIQALTIAHLFPFEAVQKHQHSQLCVLRENSNVKASLTCLVFHFTDKIQIRQQKHLISMKMYRIQVIFFKNLLKFL